jgi:hypothetical protein
MVGCKATVVATLVMSVSVQAQLNTFDIRVSNVITPSQPLAVVEVWAVWDPQYYAFASANFDMLAESDSGDFSDPERMLTGPGSMDGIVEPGGDRVLGIRPTQLHYPPPGILADTSNPILAWRVVWSTSDFTPRSTALSTVTSEFDLYINDAGVPDQFIDQFTEGAGVIHVVPSSASAGALLVLAAGRSRRRPGTGGSPSGLPGGCGRQRSVRSSR